MTLLLIVLGTWIAFTLAYRALALGALRGVLESARAPLAEAPALGAVSLLRPLRGAPNFFETCLASLFEAAEVAGARVIAGVSSAADPAHDSFLRVREALGGETELAELRVAPGPRGANRKVANLVQLSEGEKADFQLLTDADIRVPPDYVARMLSPFADDRVGLTTCAYRSIPGQSLASRLDAIAMNSQFLPSTCLAVRFEGVHFALGASVAVRRSALEQAGGFEAQLDEPGDDYALGRDIADAGWELGWAPLVVDHHLPTEGLVAAIRRQSRWMRVTRSVRFAGYLGYGMVTHTVAPALIASGLLAWAGGPFLLPVLAAWSGETLLLLANRRALGLRPRDLALVPLADLMALAVFTASLFGRAFPPDPLVSDGGAKGTRESS